MFQAGFAWCGSREGGASSCFVLVSEIPELSRKTLYQGSFQYFILGYFRSVIVSKLILCVCVSSHTLCMRMYLLILDSWRSFNFIRELYSFCVNNMNNMNRSFSSCPRKHSFHHSRFGMQHTQLRLLRIYLFFKLENYDTGPWTKLGIMPVDWRVRQIYTLIWIHMYRDYEDKEFVSKAFEVIL